MFRALSLRVFVCVAFGSCGAAVAADDDAGGFTLYPPMTPEAASPASEPSRVSIAPGELPDSENLLLDGRVILRAGPPDGYCVVPVHKMLLEIFRRQYGLGFELGGLALGYAIDCALFDEVGGGDPYPISVMLQPMYENGVPMTHGLQRAELLAGWRQQIGDIVHPEIAFDGADEAASAIAKWMAEVNAAGEGEKARRRIGGDLGRDAAAGYIAILTAGGILEGKRVFRAAVVGVTVLNGYLVAMPAFAQIDAPEDLQRLHDVAKLYARHLIEVNERHP